MILVFFFLRIYNVLLFFFSPLLLLFVARLQINVYCKYWTIEKTYEVLSSTMEMKKYPSHFLCIDKHFNLIKIDALLHK